MESSGRHIRTHLLVDMDRRNSVRGSQHNLNHYGGDSNGPRRNQNANSQGGGRTGSGGIGTPTQGAHGGGGGGGFSDPSRQASTRQRRTPPGRENSRRSADGSGHRPSTSGNIYNNNNRPPFIQISCPRPIDNHSSGGVAGGSSSTSAATSTSSLGSISSGSTASNNGGRSTGATAKMAAVSPSVSARAPSSSAISSSAPRRQGSFNAQQSLGGHQLLPQQQQYPQQLQQQQQQSRLRNKSPNRGGSGSVGSSPSAKMEHVNEDCFIIPAHRMGTFLPVSLPQADDKAVGALGILHVDDPKLCIILHFAEPGAPLLPQMTALKNSLTRVSRAGNASEGMVLMNLERNAAYPFIVYLVINTTQTQPCTFLQTYNAIIVDELRSDKFNGSGTNYISGYEEVATIVRPPIDIGPKTPSTSQTGYLISIFKVFPGDDREKLERSWLLWTGARMIYKHLATTKVGLRRITFHKKLCPDGGITYVLLCECDSLLEHITIACGFVEQLRARCCGYTALYKSVDKF